MLFRPRAATGTRSNFLSKIFSFGDASGLENHGFTIVKPTFSENLRFHSSTPSGSDFDRFSITFASQKPRNRRKSKATNPLVFGLDFESMLVPFWLHLGSIWGYISYQKRQLSLPRVFGGLVGALLLDFGIISARFRMILA